MKLLSRLLLLTSGLWLLAAASAGASALQEGDELHPFLARTAPQTVGPDLPVAATEDDAFNAELAKAEAELQAKLRPFAGLYGAGFRDKNDITVLHGGGFAGATFWETLNLRLQGMTGQIHQDAKGSRRETNVWRTSAALSFADLFLTPRLVLWGGLGYEGFALSSPTTQLWQDTDGTTNRWRRTPLERGYVLGGKLGLKYVFDNESEAGAEVKRESLWSEHDKFDTRLFNRITDMTRLAPDMAVDKARLFTNIVTFPEQQFRAEGGLDSLEDGNLRKWGYAHYQLPFPWSKDKHWMVVRPNFYVESCDEQKPGYFSPNYHITTGLMFHTIQEFESFVLEAEANPQLLWTKDDTKTGQTQEGIHGLLNIAYKYKGFQVGVGGFVYADTDDYWLYRGNVFLKYSF